MNDDIRVSMLVKVCSVHIHKNFLTYLRTLSREGLGIHGRTEGFSSVDRSLPRDINRGRVDSESYGRKNGTGTVDTGPCRRRR